jgi:2-polyprenyl-6-methoxyphenol hydroxylase-like FAD-dependent oxidoreductase
VSGVCPQTSRGSGRSGMHRRIVSRLTDCRRFLIGDAAHLSSAFGGEGLNAGLHDAFDRKVQATAHWDEHTAALE